jgi:hypothetical protein
VSAALALDPSNRQDGLDMLFGEYELAGRCANDDVAWNRARPEPYMTQVEREENDVTVMPGKEERVNSFASKKYQSRPEHITHERCLGLLQFRSDAVRDEE